MTSSAADLPTSAANNLRGITAMSVSMAFLIVNDVFVKLTGDHLPKGEVMFLRGFLTLTMLLIYGLAVGKLAKLPLMRTPKVLVRAFGEFGATFCFLSALFNMPIANATTIIMAVPLVITAVAAVALREQVGLRRWSAILIGFCGVLLIVKPASDSFNVYSLWAFAAVGFVTLRDMVTRTITMEIPSLVMAVATAIFVTVGGLAMSATEQWVIPSTRDLLFMAAAAACLVVAYQTAVASLRYGEVAVVSPFRYSIVLFSLTAGYLVWADVPDLWALVGMALIIAMGVYTFHRERRRSQQLAAVKKPGMRL